MGRRREATGKDGNGDRPTEPSQARSRDTRVGLLEAAERIIIEEGIRVLTVRRVGAVSGLNPTLVTYHFGTMTNLQAELCRLNLEPMLADWAAIGAHRSFTTLREVLEAWMPPLLRPAVFTSNGRSLIVLDEIAAHGDEEMSLQLLEPMLKLSSSVQQALQPFVPHLSARELRARVRFLSAATLGPPPRARMTDTDQQGLKIDGIEYLLNFAEAALSGK